MTYYLILWMFACPVSYVTERFQGPFIPGFTQYIEERSDYSQTSWDKARNLRECQDGLAVWAKAKKVTKVEQVQKPGRDQKDGLSLYVIVEEVKTVVYERD